MYKEIKPNNAIFKSKEFQEGKYKFNIILKNLPIYLMTNDILEKGLVPLLYTDYNYIPSNKAYINAGYEDKGILINFSCSKKKG